MIEIGDKINKRLKHFSDICPDIPLEEQVELRKLGNQYLEVLDKLLVFGKFRTKNLNGHISVEKSVFSLIDNRHTAFADFLY